MIGIVPEKNEVTRLVRDAALASFEASGNKVSRPNIANGNALFGEVFVCFNVQHTQFKTDERLDFCVNFGVLPAEMYFADWTGYGHKYPHEIDAVYRSRLNPGFRKGDWWWKIFDVDQVPRVLEEVSHAVELMREDDLPRLDTLAKCLDGQNITNGQGLYTDLLKKWMMRDA